MYSVRQFFQQEHVAMEEVLNEFASRTRHRQHELEDEPDVHRLIKKLLVTQAPISNWVKVYPFVSDDFKAIEHRTPGALENMALHYEWDPALLSTLLTQSKMTTEKGPIFQDYIQQVQPPQDAELLFFFLHGQRKKNLHAHLEHALDDHDERARIHDAIRDYEVPKDADKKEVRREIGFLIAGLQLPLVDDLFVSCHAYHPNGSDSESEEEEEEEEEEQEKEVPVANQDPMDLSPHEPKEWTLDNERRLRQNPILKEYKKKAQLTTRFPARKAAAQMLMVLIQPSGTSVPIGKTQTNVPTKQDVELDQELMDALVYSLSPEQVDSLLRTPHADKLFHALRHVRECSEQVQSKTDLAKRLLWIHTPGYAESVTAGPQRRAVASYLRAFPEGLPQETVNTLFLF
jgi:hypothetical protein